ncbi:hypothetical protein N9458_02370 [Gammaproteobacteria bacterium]|nr:hypothetical protein [Gammaproteobacteria bacterium]
MEWWEILLAIIFSFFYIPLTGLILGSFIGFAWSLIDKLLKKSDEYKEKHGEFKTNYVVAFIIGGVFWFIAVGSIYAS